MTLNQSQKNTDFDISGYYPQRSVCFRKVAQNYTKSVSKTTEFDISGDYTPKGQSVLEM